MPSTGKHIGIFMRTTVDLPGDLLKRVKIAAVKRGSTLRDLVAEALRQLLADQAHPARKRMIEAPIKLPQGHTIPIRSNREIAQMFEQKDVANLNELYRGR
jgi:metal-responsive CopG/Arc/MetJ family transcriptional regulator